MSVKFVDAHAAPQPPSYKVTLVSYPMVTAVRVVAQDGRCWDLLELRADGTFRRIPQGSEPEGFVFGCDKKLAEKQ